VNETSAPTIVIADDETVVGATWFDDRPVVDPAALWALLGWNLKPEGLCRGDTCVPIPDRSALEHPEGIDLMAAAGALGRPSLADPDAHMVAIGVPADDRQRALVDRQAPDATLLDLEGNQRQLSEWSGTRRLLVAFSSW
jgi:hypothetical protein